MATVFDSFEKKHDWLVCVDSDGCAMDTMDCKHFHCFGPCLVEEWQLDAWRVPILERWNDINLYSMTRGVNRFKGLAMALTEVNARYTPIDGVQELNDWVRTSPALSNDALAAALANGGHPVLAKALAWSKAVNAAIVRLPEELKVPFAGAKEGLAAAKTFADVAIVSSANRDAVVEEWEKFGLLAHTDITLAQDCGSKAACIEKMLAFGYAPDHVLMVGDAPGDCDAAEKNGVWYYPILVRREAESWEELRTKTLEIFQNGGYGDVQAEKKAAFLKNLGG